MASSTDCIHVTYPLHARRGRVWEAISDAGQFGFWFGAEINGKFAVGTPLTGRIVPTRSHPGIGRAQKPYLGTTFEVSVDRVEPMCSFAFSWRPLTTASGESYPPEPETFVAFELEETAGGTNLTITESGLDRNPLPVGGTPAARLISGPEAIHSPVINLVKRVRWLMRSRARWPGFSWAAPNMGGATSCSTRAT